MLIELIDKKMLLEDVRRELRYAPTYIQAKVEKCIREAPVIEPPPNAPLTMEQLREMCGKPVWIRNLCSGDYTRRVIAQSDEHFTLLADGCLRENRSYGSHWLGYRRKPEEGRT